MKLHRWVWEKIVTWLTTEQPSDDLPLSDFDRLTYEIRPCDALLVEGQSRVSDIIKTITLSSWTHSALYIGRLHDIDDPDVRAHIQKYYDGPEDEQLIIEALLGLGTIVEPLSKYAVDHIRICRPRGIAPKDAQRVIRHAAYRLGTGYDVRQLLDLARFLFPYGLLPRRWRSSLFAHNAGSPTKTVCSSMMAEAFASVQFPILPVLQQSDDGDIKLYTRNFKLITPRDFDYSPYFDVVKYPVFDFDDLTIYRRLPWGKDAVIEKPDMDIGKIHHEHFEKSAPATGKTTETEGASAEETAETETSTVSDDQSKERGNHNA